jgi:hypothetical protein
MSQAAKPEVPGSVEVVCCRCRQAVTPSYHGWCKGCVVEHTTEGARKVISSLWSRQPSFCVNATRRGVTSWASWLDSEAKSVC